MKKSILMAGAALLTLGLASCGGNSCDKGAACDAKSDVDVVYTGVLPSADCDGVRYTLLLDYDDNNTEGDYTLVETYIQADTLSAIGYKDVQSFVSEGDFAVRQKDGKSYLKLEKDAKDSSAGSIDTPIYLLVDSESTLTLTNEDLDVSNTPGMNYTLTKSK